MTRPNSKEVVEQVQLVFERELGLLLPCQQKRIDGVHNSIKNQTNIQQVSLTAKKKCIASLLVSELRDMQWKERQWKGDTLHTKV